jgi:hypothetical protein
MKAEVAVAQDAANSSLHPYGDFAYAPYREPGQRGHDWRAPERGPISVHCLGARESLPC